MRDEDRGTRNEDQGHKLNLEPDVNPRTSNRILSSNLIFVLLAVAVTIPVYLKSRPSELLSAQTAFSVPVPTKGYVRVSGDVRHPGLYSLTANMLTMDAIQLAEPLKAPTSHAPGGIGSAPLKDGADIRVSISSGGMTNISSGSLPASHRIILGIPLDINAMSVEDFDRLPGVGPVLAKRIIEYRQKCGGIMGVKDLLSIEGIGEKKYNHLKNYFN